VEDLRCGLYTGDRCEANPRGVHGGYAFTALSAGWDHTCGVTAGTLVCWGANGAGQLGATTTQYSCPVRGAGTQPCAPYPVHVGFPLPSSELQVTAVAAGGAHTCALTADGTAYCWGANDHGQLGIGTAGDRGAPTLVAAEGIVFRELTAAYDHTCGIATNGDAYCWGNSSDGQLGDGTTTDRSVPVRVRRPGP
jgi:alpha-tubulin suppressor-like RCC1 family protein